MTLGNFVQGIVFSSHQPAIDYILDQLHPKEYAFLSFRCECHIILLSFDLGALGSNCTHFAKRNSNHFHLNFWGDAFGDPVSKQCGKRLFLNMLFSRKLGRKMKLLLVCCCCCCCCYCWWCEESPHPSSLLGQTVPERIFAVMSFPDEKSLIGGTTNTWEK